jgi:arylsulfatase A-like enzyme
MPDRLARLDRRNFLKVAAGTALGVAAGSGLSCARPSGPRNLLFIVIEDWNARSAGCYGDPIVRTPHLDRFAETALRFERAYCQAPGCNPSRSSFLSGLRPHTTRVLGNRDRMDRLLPQGTKTLPELFADAGFATIGIGKLFHLAYMAGPQLSRFDRLELCDMPKGYAGISMGYAPPLGTPEPPPRKFAYSSDPAVEARLSELATERDARSAEVEVGSKEWIRAQIRFRNEYSELVGDSGETEEQSLDGQRARLCAQILPELARADQPFFLSLGFSRPHVPLLVPKPYLDLYPPESMPEPWAPEERDREIPPIARRFGRNFDLFSVVPRTPERERAALAAYYACLTFIDTQLGIVLDALDAAGLADSTAVVVMGDHGFHLGEHGLWSKVTLFEQSTRVPLFLRVPGAPANGRSSAAIVEFVDLVPTLAELFDLAVPQALEGSSMAPLLEAPDRSWKRAAFSVCKMSQSTGRGVRTARFRYSEWPTPMGLATELYDLESDPWEHLNLAGNPNYREVAAEHKALIQAGWRAALPAA